MSDQGRKIVKRMAGILRPPLFFDFLIYGSLCINLFKGSVNKEIFFVFYAFFLLVVSFGLKQQRAYISWPLALLVLWGLVSVFIHSYYLPETSFVMRYKNTYLMYEGFIYLFAGAALLITATKYLYKTNLFYIFTPAILYPWLRELFMPRITFLFACLISGLIYSIIKKKYWLITLIVIISTLGYIKFNSHFKGSYNCRKEINIQLLKEIQQHPFIGAGYNESLKPDNMMFDNYNGWLYRHNDYLSIAAYIGLPALILVLLFLFQTFYRIRTTPYFYLLLPFIITCFFQMTIFVVEKALSIILISSWILAKTYKQEALQ